MKIDTYGWAPIVKSEKQDDGTLLVTGRVSDDGLDRDAQRCDAAWLDQAVPQWFAEGGNVREMHSNIAAGVALQHWKADDGGHMVTAHVVDAGSITKVENKVLRGFSIGIKGGRVTKSLDAPNGLIVGGNIIEVSLVDRPANPSCLLAIAKADEATGEAVEVEQQLVVKGEALPEPEKPTMRTLPDALTKDEGLPQPSTEPAEVKEVPVDTVARVSEDVRVAARGVLDALAGLDLPPWKKADDGDESADIANAQQAIAIIARLIQSEAESLAAGELSEAYDVATLLEAVSALRWFIRSEQAETVDQAVADSMVGLALADDPELVKTDQPTDDTTPVETPGVVLTKAEADAFWADAQAKVEGIVAEALTKAEEVHKAELDALRTELAEVKAQPVAGGPVRVRTTQDRAKADQLDAVGLLEQAAEWERRAGETNDRTLADGYRTLARDARTKAAR